MVRCYSVSRQFVHLALKAQYAYNRQLKVQAFGQLAQLVEQGIENPCVLGSIPRLATTLQKTRFGGLFYGNKSAIARINTGSSARREAELCQLGTEVFIARPLNRISGINPDLGTLLPSAKK